jgi:hypothetical protein
MDKVKVKLDEFLGLFRAEARELIVDLRLVTEHLIESFDQFCLNKVADLIEDFFDQPLFFLA